MKVESIREYYKEPTEFRFLKPGDPFEWYIPERNLTLNCIKTNSPLLRNCLNLDTGELLCIPNNEDICKLAVVVTETR